MRSYFEQTHGQIPPPSLESPVFRAMEQDRPSEVTPWPDGPRVAGVNAFGFGGVSAHMVLSGQLPAGSGQQGQTTLTTQQTENSQRAGLAIVGMDAQFGGVEDLAAFEQTIYDGAQHFGPLPSKRWKGLADDAPHGAYLESFEIDFLRFKFPPKEDDQPTPQHLLLLKVADNAVRDAKLAEGANVAVIVAMGTELSLHHIAAARSVRGS